jgi:hypothetical protein
MTRYCGLLLIASCAAHNPPAASSASAPASKVDVDAATPEVIAACIADNPHTAPRDIAPRIDPLDTFLAHAPLQSGALRSACLDATAGVTDPALCETDRWISVAAAECIARAAHLPAGISQWEVYAVAANHTPVWVVAATEARDGPSASGKTLQIDAVTGQIRAFLLVHASD